MPRVVAPSGSLRRDSFSTVPFDLVGATPGPPVADRMRGLVRDDLGAFAAFATENRRRR